jgi:hypothetical protein
MIATGLASPSPSKRLIRVATGEVGRANSRSGSSGRGGVFREAFRRKVPLVANRKKGGSVPLRYGSVPWF